MRNKVKNFAFWFSILSSFSLGIVIFSFFAIQLHTEAQWIMKIYKDHFVATIGLPLVAVSSVFIISVFKQQSNEKIHFKIKSLEFNGASGEITLWIMVYIVQVLSLYLLW